MNKYSIKLTLKKVSIVDVVEATSLRAAWKIACSRADNMCAEGRNVFGITVSEQINLPV